MKIYTSSFNKLKKLPKTLTPISVSARPPKWYKGIEFKALAPTQFILHNWEQTQNRDDYFDSYQYILLDKTPKKAIEIINDAGVTSPVLIAGNSDGIVIDVLTEWFKEAGIEVEPI